MQKVDFDEFVCACFYTSGAQNEKHNVLASLACSRFTIELHPIIGFIRE